MEFDPARVRMWAIGVVAGLTVTQILIPRALGPSGEHALFDTFALLAGAGLVVFGFVVLRRKRLLENVPTSRIRSVAMGFAELAGRAKVRTEALSAPFSGIPCVFYRFQVEEERQTQRGRRWTTVEQGASSEPFYLEDETGTLLVDPSGAETVLQRSYQTFRRDDGWFSRRKRLSEWWIVPGQTLFVAGTVMRLRDEAFDRRVVLNDRLREIKRDPARLKSFDTNQDGEISTEEWGNAVLAVRSELAQEDLKAPPEPPEETVGIGKGSDETTFVIAERGERPLLLKLGLTSGAAIVCGGVATSAFLVSLLTRAGVLSGWVFSW